MNIADVNSSPLLSSTSSSEGVPAPLTGNNAVPEGFTGTLMEQIALLSAAISQSELPQQLQNFAQSKVINTVNSSVCVLENKDDLQKLAALPGKELPMSYKINEDASSEANPAALTDVLKYITADAVAEKATTDQNVDEAMMRDAQAQMSPRQVGSGLSTERVENKAENQTEDSQIVDIEDIENPGIIPGLLTPLALPEVKPAEKKIDDSSANAVVIKEEAVLSLVRPLVADGKLNSLEEDTSFDIFLPKAAAFNPSVQDQQQGMDLNSFAKAVLIERQPPVLVADKAAPQQILDMAQLDRQVTTRTDVPAIIKPLAHPDWSRDMGDRIIWMNNKAIPAAEIKLNPQHLGPISVRIDINQDQATITFSAQHGVVREALEASIPRLREMMSAQQLNLVEVNISQHNTSDQGRSSPQGFAQTSGGSGRGQGNVSIATEGVTDVVEDIENGQAVVSKGLLSLYA
jgi:flagellar hook-length control protein FliK